MRPNFEGSLILAHRAGGCQDRLGHTQGFAPLVPDWTPIARFQSIDRMGRQHREVTRATLGESGQCLRSPDDEYFGPADIVDPPCWRTDDLQAVFAWQ